ncbi:MAG: hypothetical protein C0482_16235 [Gordonia sp.]|nr:hypothetical protein [Gordonia sp. (in: high G+C Gram-positive bacteria)]
MRAALPDDAPPIHQWAPMLTNLLRAVDVEVHSTRNDGEVFILLTPTADADADAAKHAATKHVASPRQFGMLGAARTHDPRNRDD